MNAYARHVLDRRRVPMSIPLTARLGSLSMGFVLGMWCALMLGWVR